MSNGSNPINPRSFTTQSKELYGTIQGVVRHNPRSCAAQPKDLYDTIYPRTCATRSTQGFVRHNLSKELYDSYQSKKLHDKINPRTCTTQSTQGLVRHNQSKDLYDTIQGLVRHNHFKELYDTINPRTCTTQSIQGLVGHVLCMRHLHTAHLACAHTQTRSIRPCVSIVSMALFAGLFTGHDSARGSGQVMTRVGSGRVRRCSNPHTRPADRIRS